MTPMRKGTTPNTGGHWEKPVKCKMRMVPISAAFRAPRVLRILRPINCIPPAPRVPRGSLSGLKVE
jgi:hypothetical protein